jgi:hypothetical protein
MSDESIQLIRKPMEAERHLLAVLISKADNLNLPTEWLETLNVQQMNDAGMGSLRLLSFDASTEKRIFDKQASTLIFEDVDGVKVIASLNIDSSGMPMELDLWKTDFSPLICIPIDLTKRTVR